MFFPCFVATLLLCATTQISAMDAASTSTASTDFSERSTDSASLSGLLSRLGLIAAAADPEYGNSATLKTPSLKNIIGHRLLIEAKGPLTAHDGDMLEPLRKASAKQPYADLLLAMYALSGSHGHLTPSIADTWYPAEVTKDDHPLRRLQRLAIPEASSQYPGFPEAAFFLTTLYNDIPDGAVDEWGPSNKESCQDLVNQCDQECVKAGKGAVWEAEKSHIHRHVQIYLSLKKDSK